MKFKTKHTRLVAIADMYCAVHGRTTFTTDEVVDWAISKQLHPVPKRGDSIEVCEEWESRLEAAGR